MLNQKKIVSGLFIFFVAMVSFFIAKPIAIAQTGNLSVTITALSSQRGEVRISGRVTGSPSYYMLKMLTPDPQIVAQNNFDSPTQPPQPPVLPLDTRSYPQGSKLTFRAEVGAGNGPYVLSNILTVTVDNPPPSPPAVTIWVDAGNGLVNDKDGVPVILASGQVATLRWLSTGAERCQTSGGPAGGGWPGFHGENGSYPLIPSYPPLAVGTYTYTITCTGPLGVADDSVTLTVTNTPDIFDCTDLRFEGSQDVRFWEQGNKIFVCSPGLLTGCLSPERFPGNYQFLISGAHHIFYEGAHNERGVVVCSQAGEEAVSLGPFRYCPNPNVIPWVRTEVRFGLPTGGLGTQATKYTPAPDSYCRDTTSTPPPATTDTWGPGVTLTTNPSPWDAKRLDNEVTLTITANDRSGVNSATIEVGKDTFPPNCRYPASFFSLVTMECTLRLLVRNLPLGQIIKVTAIDKTVPPNTSIGTWTVKPFGSLSSGRSIINAFTLEPSSSLPPCTPTNLQQIAEAKQRVADFDRAVALEPNPLLKNLWAWGRTGSQSRLTNFQNSCQTTTPNSNTKPKTTCVSSLSSNGVLPSSVSGADPSLLNQLLVGECQ